MYQTILFDLDGTLTDPGIGITNSVMYALEKFGITVEDRAQLYKFIGPPLTDSFRDFYGFDEEKSKLAVEYYREYFKVKGLYENEIYPGIKELLKALKERGKNVILATSKPESFAIRILEFFGIKEYFDFIAGATMDGSRGEKAGVIRYALEMSGTTDISTAVMVGDRKFDIMGAQENQLDSIGVLFGYGSREELAEAKATYLVETPEDIFRCVEGE